MLEAFALVVYVGVWWAYCRDDRRSEGFGMRVRVVVTRGALSDILEGCWWRLSYHKVRHRNVSKGRDGRSII